MAKYRPLEPRDHLFTQVDNYLLDYVMPVSPPNAWKILCFIVRKTKGWVDSETGTRKSRDRLSYSQIMKGTGIKHPKTISTGIQFLVKEQYVLAFGSADDWEANEYELNTQLEVELPTTSNNEVVPASKSEVGSTSKNEDTKERVKKERKTDTTLRANDARAEPPQAMLFDDILPDITKQAPPPEKKPRQPDTYLDTIMLLWQVPATRAASIKQQLQGRVPKSKPHHHTNLSPPVELEEAIEFATRYYPRACKGCSLPKSPEKLQDHIEAMRREKGQQAADIKAGGVNLPDIGYQPFSHPELNPDYYE